MQNRKISFYKSIFKAASSLDTRPVYLVVSLLNVNSIHSVAIHGNIKQLPYCAMRRFKNHKATSNDQAKGWQSHKHPEALKRKENAVFTTDKPRVPGHSGNARALQYFGEIPFLPRTPRPLLFPLLCTHQKGLQVMSEASNLCKYTNKYLYIATAPRVKYHNDGPQLNSS